MNPPAAQADDSLTMMTAASAPGLYDVMEFVADRMGFFKAEHITLSKQYVNSPSAAAQLVGTGKGDICSASYEAVLQGYQHGLHLEYFLSRSSRYSNVVAVLDDSPVRTLGDLKGKNIGVINIGSAGQVTAESMLAGAGLKPTDVTYSPIGMGPQAVNAIVSKRVDAVGYPYGEVVPVEVVGNVKMRVFRHPLLKDVANTGFAASPDAIVAKADVLRRFSRAIVMAALFVRYNPAVSARFFLEAGGQQATPDNLARETKELEMLQDDLPAADPSNKRMGYLSPTGMELFSQMLTDAGMTAQVVPASAVLTNAFVPYANDFDHQAVIALAKRTK